MRLSTFLRLAGLDRVVASSSGACHARQVQLEQTVVTFTVQQRQHLAGSMAPRDITVAADETYHPACCLVAMDADAGFLLVEKYAAHRDQATWDAALAEGLVGLPAVRVRQVAGDCAKGLVAHAEQGLGVPHSPDLFHAQHELTKALAPALGAQTREARRWLERTQDNRTKAQQAATAAEQPPGRGRPVDHAAKVAQAEQSVTGMERCVGVLEESPGSVACSCPRVGSGRPPSRSDQRSRAGCRHGAPAVGTTPGGSRTTGRAGAGIGQGSSRAKKVRRQVPGLVAAVAFFWTRAEAGALARFGAGAWLWVKGLLCGEYVRRVAGQSKGAERRRGLRALAERCGTAARAVAGAEPACGWAAAERWCREVAGWFVRSSSAVEGRNGQLALRYHSLHRLPERKLRALTAIHNYWLKRGDGTTAAERFFGSKPDDLFQYLLAQLPVPARPARRRTKVA